ncbi:hypothetical protein D0Z07_3453 [Hyphodiscus hymeniophilus]|uniref:Uncharacterized protein n=1 Tax=Hyphodiscus hymeniophilus TaxID=353542 RepID=A0A9P6VMQ7_9HELO|nr:hypothetical protein D0Z07_3453 [Hyphodiscus hymeniophilus]
MAPIRSPILSALARTRFQQTPVRQFRQASTAAKSRATTSPNWESPSRRVAGTVMIPFMQVRSRGSCGDVLAVRRHTVDGFASYQIKEAWYIGMID